MQLKFELFVVLKQSNTIISFGLYDSYDSALNKINSLINAGKVERKEGTIKGSSIEDRGWQVRRMWID